MIHFDREFEKGRTPTLADLDRLNLLIMSRAEIQEFHFAVYLLSFLIDRMEVVHFDDRDAIVRLVIPLRYLDTLAEFGADKEDLEDGHDAEGQSYSGR